MHPRATSSGRPNRPTGIWDFTRSYTFSGIAWSISVAMKPGATALTVGPRSYRACRRASWKRASRATNQTPTPSPLPPSRRACLCHNDHKQSLKRAVSGSARPAVSDLTSPNADVQPSTPVREVVQPSTFPCRFSLVDRPPVDPSA